MHGEQLGEDGGQVFQVEGVGAVGLGFFGIVVDFHEDAVDAGGDGGTAEQGNELGLAAADCGAIFVAVRCRWELDGVGGVKDDGGEVAHDGEGAHVDYEIVVAEARAAFGEEDSLAASGATFVDGVLHIPGGDELAFLDIHGAAALAAGDNEVGLAAEESGDLEDVGDFGDAGDVGGFVDVGEDGDADGVSNFFQNAEAFLETRAAKALKRGAIGFVVGGFEDVGDADAFRDRSDRLGHFEGVGFALDDAGAGDEKELSSADGDGADLKGVCQWCSGKKQFNRRVRQVRREKSFHLFVVLKNFLGELCDLGGEYGFYRRPTFSGRWNNSTDAASRCERRCLLCSYEAPTKA